MRLDEAGLHGLSHDMVMRPEDIFYDDEGGSDSLGRGACGTVSKAVHGPTGKRLAIKVNLTHPPKS